MRVLIYDKKKIYKDTGRPAGSLRGLSLLNPGPPVTGPGGLWLLYPQGLSTAGRSGPLSYGPVVTFSAGCI